LPASAYLSLATGYCLVDDVKRSTKMMSRFDNCIKMKSDRSLISDNYDENTYEAGSQGLFAKHKMNELEIDGKRLKECLSSLTKSECETDAFDRLKDFYFRTLWFPSEKSYLTQNDINYIDYVWGNKEHHIDGTTESNKKKAAVDDDIYNDFYFLSKKAISPTIIKGLRLAKSLRSFGLFGLFHMKMDGATYEPTNDKLPVNDKLRRFAKHYGKALSDDSFINFGHIFGNENPVNVEVGSGTGEWIIQRAKEDPDYNWVAIELRHDRCYQIFTRLVLENINNCCILGGDGSFLMQNKFGESIIQNIYINFPEPPTFFDRQCNLLSASFFKSMHRVLSQNSRITIVSDNDLYMKVTCGEIVSLKTMFSLCHRQPFVEGLPDDYRSTTSYFDRFWSHGGKSQRMHIIAKKN